MRRRSALIWTLLRKLHRHPSVQTTIHNVSSSTPTSRAPYPGLQTTWCISKIHRHRPSTWLWSFDGAPCRPGSSYHPYLSPLASPFSHFCCCRGGFVAWYIQLPEARLLRCHFYDVCAPDKSAGAGGARRRDLFRQSDSLDLGRVESDEG